MAEYIYLHFPPDSEKSAVKKVRLRLGRDIRKKSL
jgi:hypothetical protein